MEAVKKVKKEKFLLNVVFPECEISERINAYSDFSIENVLKKIKNPYNTVIVTHDGKSVELH